MSLCFFDTSQREADRADIAEKAAGMNGQAPADGPAGETTRHSQSEVSNETFIKAAQEGVEAIHLGSNTS